MAELFLNYLFERQRDGEGGGGEREGESVHARGVPYADLFSKCLQQLGQSSSKGLSVALPRGGGLQLREPSPLPPRVCISGTLRSGAELGWSPGTDVGGGHLNY